MSLSGEQAFPSRVILCGGCGRVLEMLGSRGVSVNEIWPCVPWHRVTHYTLCPLG